MSSIALNVGCHDIHMEGFVNIDLDPEMAPDLLADATKLLEHYSPGTVDFIYCGQFLEHLPVAVGRGVCRDFHALLRDYGSLIVVVPDYSKCPPSMSIEERERIILAEGTHLCLMDEARVRDYLSEAGFTTVTSPELREIPHCPFPHVTWQTALLAIKHPAPGHRGPRNKKPS